VKVKKVNIADTYWPVVNFVKCHLDKSSFSKLNFCKLTHWHNCQLEKKSFWQIGICPPVLAPKRHLHCLINYLMKKRYSSDWSWIQRIYRQSIFQQWNFWRRDNQSNNILQNDTQHDNTLHYNTQYNNTLQNDAQHDNTLHNNTQCNVTQYSDAQFNGTQPNDAKHTITRQKPLGTITLVMFTFGIATISIMPSVLLYSGCCIHRIQHVDTWFGIATYTLIPLAIMPLSIIPLIIPLSIMNFNTLTHESA
jgi:hypothetical protein